MVKMMIYTRLTRHLRRVMTLFILYTTTPYNLLKEDTVIGV